MVIVSEDFDLVKDSFSSKNIISLLRYNLNNNEVLKKKVLNYACEQVEKRMSAKYLNIQKEIDRKLNKKKKGAKHDLDCTRGNNNDINSDHKSKDILFDHILSNLITSDKLETKLDILTLLEEHYGTVIGDPDLILRDKSCWNRYNIVFRIFDHIITLNHYRLATEVMDLYEASTNISKTSAITVSNIHDSLLRNKSYSISASLQSQVLIAFTSIAISINLMDIIPYWFSKLITILFIISKDECIIPQKINEKNIDIYQNYFYIKKYANECLNELNRNYPLLFNNLLNSSVISNSFQRKLSDKDEFIINYIKNNISKSVWPNSLERHFMNELNGSCNNSTTKNSFSNNLSTELVVSIITSVLSTLKKEERLLAKLIKEKERFLTYLVTYIMEDLHSTSTWNLHRRILFLKYIVKTLSIPSNVLESSLLPLSYSSKMHIQFEISLFIIEEIYTDLFNTSFNSVIGLINNYLMPNNTRIYSSLWFQLLITNYKSNFISYNSNYNITNVLNKLLVPKWYDSSTLKYYKFLLIMQLKLKNITKLSEGEFHNLLNDSFNSLSEYLVIKAPIGSHSVYLKLLFKVSLLFGMEPFVVDIIFKYSSHNNYLVLPTHIINTIKLIHLILTYSTNKQNYEQINTLIYSLINYIKSLTSPKDINPFLIFLLYLSKEHKLVNLCSSSIINDVISTLHYITHIFLEGIRQPTMRWVYLNKIYSVCLDIMISNIHNFEIKHSLNKLIKFIKGALKIYDTQIFDSIIEMENTINNLSIKAIKSLYESENAIQVENTNDVDLYQEERINDFSMTNSSVLNKNTPFDTYEIKLVKCEYFRKELYNLNDNDSFSIYTNNHGGKDSIIILPFQLIFSSKSEIVELEKICIYALKFDFKSSNNSLEMETLYIPFLKLQEKQTNDMENINTDDIYDSINSSNREIVNINDNLVFLFIKAKINHPSPCLVSIHLVFNDEFGSIHNIRLEDVHISFQDLFVPSLEKERALIYCYNAIKEKLRGPESQNYTGNIVYACKVLDLPSKSILDCIDKYIKIFEMSDCKLRDLIGNELSLCEDFDFKHDFLMNRYEIFGDSHTGKENSDVNVNCRWFYIDLFPDYHLIFQFSVTNYVTVVRIYTDLYDVLTNCDNLFDRWLNECTN